MRSRCLIALFSTWAILFLSFTLHAQDEMETDSTGLPGDNFSLEGAIELFKKANSLEEFEKLLNTEDNNVNNLDLNEDGEIDYIRVVDNMDGDAHAIVLQVPVSADESQDIAVIEIEKQGDENAVLQIVGDEDIYGEQVIAEPYEQENMKNGRGGPAMQFQPVPVIVNVWLWPSVRFMYRPAYRVWVSPWHWRYYPTYWRPWHPHPFYWFHPRVLPYRAHCHVIATHRVVRAHAVYAPRRTHSTVVRTRTTTIVEGRHGNSVKRTTTTTKVHGRNGGRATERTTTTKVRRGGDGGGNGGGGGHRQGKGGGRRGRG